MKIVETILIWTGVVVVVVAFPVIAILFGIDWALHEIQIRKRND